MSKRYTALAQVFKAIVETLSESHNPNKRYVVPREFEDLFRKAFPAADGDPGRVEDDDVEAFITKEVLISKKISVNMGKKSGIDWAALDDVDARRN
jgi:hypothetical protein